MGKSDNVKRPEILLQLAQACPDISFEIVMNKAVVAIYDAILQNKPPNVVIYEWKRFDEIEALFAEAFVFISTSRYEGFPNTFLQAGKYGVPIFSLQVDPDGFIEKYACGIVAHGNFDRFVAGLREIADDQEIAQRYSVNVSQYVIEHHALNQRVDQLDRAIHDLVAHQ